MTPNTRRTVLRTACILLASAIVIAVTMARTMPFDPKHPEAGLTASKNPPPPGHEEILRRVIDGTQTGNPDYTLMSKDLADVVRKQRAATQQAVSAFGPLQSITYLGSVSPPFGLSLPNERYLVKFQNKPVLWIMSFDKSGKLAGLNFSAREPQTPQRMIALYAGRSVSDQLTGLATDIALMLVLAAFARYVLRVRL